MQLCSYHPNPTGLQGDAGPASPCNPFHLHCISLHPPCLPMHPHCTHLHSTASHCIPLQPLPSPCTPLHSLASPCIPLHTCKPGLCHIYALLFETSFVVYTHFFICFVQTFNQTLKILLRFSADSCTNIARVANAVQCHS